MTDDQLHHPSGHDPRAHGRDPGGSALMAMGREFVELGGLMSYGASIADFNRRSPLYVDKILKGALITHSNSATKESAEPQSSFEAKQ